jgi:hypothetical protein
MGPRQRRSGRACPERANKPASRGGGRHVRVVAIAAAAMLAATVPGAAQDGRSRVVVSLNGGGQSAGPGLSDRFEFATDPIENATVDVRYPAKPIVVVDGGLGIRFWKNLGIGVAISYATGDGSAEIDAQIPHPLQLNQPREVSGEQDAITRTETGVHVQLQYSIPMSSRVMLVLSGGPSRLNVEQELVTGVLYDEAYPFDTATFRSAPTRRSKGSVTGFNAGADLQWMFGRNVGLGGMLRFIRGSVDLTTDKDRRFSVRAGGVQAGGGLRIGF